MRNKLKRMLKLMQRSGFLVSLILILTVTIGTTLAFIIAETPSILNTFEYSHEGDIVIEKKVTHPFGEKYNIPDSVSFDFELEFLDYSKDTVIINDKEVTLQEGKTSVSLKANDSVRIKDILTDTKVKITEIDVEDDGFSVLDDIWSKEVVVETNKTVNVEFVNNYKPEAAESSSVDLRLTKELNRVWLENDVFEFNLEYFKDNEWVLVGSQAISYEKDRDDFNKIHFNNEMKTINFDSAGIYSFRISEEKGTIGGISYDNKVIYMDVTVSDLDMNGQLEITDVKSNETEVVYENDVFTLNCVFTNIYSTSGHAFANIDIKKELEDLSLQNKGLSGFAFVLYDESGNVVKKSDETMSAGETYISLVYDTQDVNKTYNYVLKEMNAGETIDGMTYDNKEYFIEVSVVDNLNGTISAKIYDKDGNKDQASDKYEAIFKNIYNVTESDPLILGGKKVLEGRDLIQGEFIFELYETDSSFEINEDSKLIDTASHDRKGHFTFKGMTYTSLKPHYYVIKEKDNGKGGVSYDSTYYKVTVLMDDNKGKLVAYADLNNEDIVFSNRYEAESAKILLEGKKSYNYDLDEGMFSFDLVKCNDKYEQVGSVIQTVKNDVNGIFKFKELNFDKTGTYYYLVKENTEDALAHIEYDATQYVVKVDVEDDALGQLHAKYKLYSLKDKTLKEVEAIEFKNTYIPESINLILSGHKTLTNYTIESDMFSFELYEADKDYKAKDLLLVTSNKSDGEFVFDPITYDYKEVGTHYYVVKEKHNMGAKYKALESQMTYDDTLYGIQVKVMEKDGKLETEYKVINLKTQEISDIKFNNTYKFPDVYEVINIDINKTIKLISKETIGPEGFKFILESNDASKCEAISDESGQAVISLTFTNDDVGTHYYRLYEVNDKKENVEYSTKVYEIEINVSLDDHGQLIINKKVDKKSVDSIECHFENIYGKKVNTSDRTQVIPFVIVSLISGAVALMMLKKKKEK